jgi:excisionase family DNA binding protein
MNGQPYPKIGIDEKAALSVDEFCEVLGIKRTTAFKLIRSGAVQSFSLGSRRLIPRGAVDDLITQRVAEATGRTDVPIHQLRKEPAAM